jgi:hypothetical protein
MVFRRPRVNVKPNVQSTRPLGSNVRTSDVPVEPISTSSQDEQPLPLIDSSTIVSPVIEGINRTIDRHFLSSPSYRLTLDRPDSLFFIR